MTEFSHLTIGEEHLMQLLWNLQTFYLKDVLEHHPEPKPHQNTISTYLKILAEKKFVTSEKEGRILRYDVAVRREEYRKFLLKNLVESYGFTPAEIILNLVSEKIIGAEDFAQFFDAEVVITANSKIFGKDFVRGILPGGKKSRKKKKSKK